MIKRIPWYYKLLRIEKQTLILLNWFKIPLTSKIREAFAGYAFISIWLVGFVVLTAIPLIESLIYSFNRITIVGGQGIQLVNVGWENFIRIITTDLTFIDQIQQFIWEIIIYVPVIIILAMVIAILLNRPFKFRSFFRAIFFLPVIITSGPVVNELLRQGAGTIPSLNESGFLTIIQNIFPSFLATPLVDLFTEIIFILWFSGVQVILFLAGLQKMDQSMYEAAQMDGANGWETFWKITLPSLKNIIFVSAIYTIVTLATFSNNPIIAYIRTAMFEGIKGYGYASALAWIYFLVIAVLLFGASLLLNPKEKRIKEKKTFQGFQR
jgi:ABC-type sugar transport system permease subunit